MDKVNKSKKVMGKEVLNFDLYDMYCDDIIDDIVYSLK